MIYLDHAAATPVDNRVLKAMLPYFSEKFANPSSTYQFGLQNRQVIDDARNRVAKVLQCSADEVYFTGSGTESNNWAIFGVARAFEKKGKHLITTLIEHHSVLASFEQLESQGWRVTYLPVNSFGHISLKDLEKCITNETVFVSISYANNEIGTIEDLNEISKILKKHNIVFHTDACQAAGSLSLNVDDLGVDMMTINGGKIYGPKGSGVLYMKRGVQISPLLYGGGQEHRQRAGTENVPNIVGFAMALELAEKTRALESKRLIEMREILINGIKKNIENAELNGDPVNRLPNNININFPGVDAESLLVRLDMQGVCASVGSACTSGAIEPSHVLMGIGIGKNLGRSSIRMTLGRENSIEDIKKLLIILPPIINDLRRE